MNTVLLGKRINHDRSKLQLSNQTKKKVLMDFKNNLKKKKKKQRTLLQTLCILVSIKPCLDKVLFYYFILQSADSSWSLSASTSGVVKLT